MGRATVLFALATLLWCVSVGCPAAVADPGPAEFDYPFRCDRASLTADFPDRDALPQTDAPPSAWYEHDTDGRYANGGWGPKAAALPAVAVPADAGCDGQTWRRERILAAAMHYLNRPDNPEALQYRHHHIPDWDPPGPTVPFDSANADDVEARAPETWSGGRGLDCSNFTAWVYNYGLGIKFGGDVRQQYAGTAGPMGQHISAQGPFQPGDLLYLHPAGADDRASHVVIYLDDAHVIDSRLNAQNLIGVQIRQREGWYRNAVLGGWRPIADQ